MKYNIYRSGSVILNVGLEGKQTRKIMDINIVDCSFTLTSFVDIKIGDYTIVDGETYVLQEMPNIKKISTIQFEYSMQFKGQAYELAKIAFMGLDGSNALTESDFVVMGDAALLVNLIVQNANRISPGWTVGVVDTTGFENFPFSKDNCLSALSTLADKFKTEWWVIGKQIFLSKKGVTETVHTFEYGQGKGLYDVTRTTVTDKNVCTRLYVYGSDKNIPADYRNYSKRLKLPAPALYLESNVAKYGIIEHVEIFDDIKPEFISNVVTAIDPFRFTDPLINFDINLVQLASTKPKVSFLTGQLAGYDFEIGGFDYPSRTIRLLKNENEKALDLPSVLLKPQAGDKYTIVDINMPASYRTDAENRLAIAGATYLGENDDPIVIYSVTCDPLNMRLKNYKPTIGNYIKFKDTHFGLNQAIRLTSYTKDLQNLFLLTFDLQEITSMAISVRAYNVYATVKSAVSINKLTDVNRARMNYKTSQELRNMVFDPEDGYFDPTNIRPLSIETTMLSVGAKSQQFSLRNCLFKPNDSGNASRMSFTSGSLVHLTIEAAIRTWNIPSGLFTGLASGNPYYIFAKCPIVGLDGTIELSTVPIKVNGVANYYYFYIGVLHSEVDGVRGISLTYGQSTINGGFITTGRIQSNDGGTFFDLNEGRIEGKIIFGAGSSGYANLLDKPDLSQFPTSTEIGEQLDAVYLVANEAHDIADAAQLAADTAAADATVANALIAQIANDDVLTPSEKGQVLREWILINTELPYIDAKADNYGISRTGYDNAYTTLNNYLNTLNIGDFTTSTAVSGNTLRTYFSSYYSWRESVLNSISVATKNNYDYALSVANTAYLNAVNAKSTADRAALITDGLFTIIDGNIIATGTLIVGDASHINAGLTGVTDAGVNSIRFWAGATYANKNIAPFRVTDAGAVTIASAISGKRIIISGADNNLSFYGSDNAVKLRIDDNAALEGYTFDPGGSIPVYGYGIVVGDTSVYYSMLGIKGLHTNGFVECNEIVTTGNIFCGDNFQVNGTATFNGNIWSGSDHGLTQDLQYSRGGANWTAKFRNGLYCGNFNAWN